MPRRGKVEVALGLAQSTQTLQRSLKRGLSHVWAGRVFLCFFFLGERSRGGKEEMCERTGKRWKVTERLDDALVRGGTTEKHERRFLIF